MSLLPAFFALVSLSACLSVCLSLEYFIPNSMHLGDVKEEIIDFIFQLLFFVGYLKRS